MSLNGNVLIVEDDPDTREMIAALLTTQGFYAVGAEDGLEALHLLRTVRHRAPYAPCLVLLDLTMPVLGGDAALDELMQREPPPRVVLTSGFSEEETAARFVGRDLAGYLRKPYRVADLIAALDRCVDAK